MSKYLSLGGRLDSVAPTGTISESTLSGSFDSSWCDASLLHQTATGNLSRLYFHDDDGVQIDLVDGETGFFHFDIYVSISAGTAASVWGLEDSSGNNWLEIRIASGTTSYGLYYNSGTVGSPVFTQVGTNFTIAADTRTTLDIKLTLDSGGSHSVELSLGGSLQFADTFTQSLLTDLRNQFWKPNASTTQVRVSQMIATEGISTIGAKVKYARSTGAGSHADWTGAHTDINEAVNSDSSVNSTSSSGQKTSYAQTDVTVPAGFKIGCVEHCMRAKNDGTTPLNIKSIIRSNGTDYTSSNLTGIGTSFGSIRRRLNVDPDTSAIWTQSGWNAAEAGFESAA